MLRRSGGPIDTIMLNRSLMLISSLLMWHEPKVMSAAALAGRTLARPNSPSSPCILAYNRLRSSCNANGRFPQSAAYNSTHELRCELVRSGCHEVQREIEFTLQRSTWWHCRATSTLSANETDTCSSRFHSDLMKNLFSAECISGTCFNHSVPAYIGSLRESALKLYTVDSASLLQCTGQGVDDTLELMANVVIQKARFCRFDMDMYTKMTDLMNLQAKQMRICSMGTGGLGGASASYSYSLNVQSQPVYQQQSYLFQAQQQQSFGK